MSLMTPTTTTTTISMATSFCGAAAAADITQLPSSCGMTAAKPLSLPTSKASPSSSFGPRASTPLGSVAMSTDVSSTQPPSLSLAAASRSAMAAAAAALLLFASPALAAKVEVGDEVGSFKFTPDTITVAAGEKIEFTLVGETGHNVVFDAVSGAPPEVADELAKVSMDENDLLSEDEPTHVVKLSTPGTYTYYCTPHKSANMRGTVIVK